MNRHLIYTNGRSGSNSFVNLFKQHPNLVNYGEVLGPWTTPGRYVKPLFRGADSGPRYLDFILGSRPAFTAVQALSYLNRKRTGRATAFRRWSETRSIGIKEFVVNFERNGLENYLSENADLTLLALVRENPIERYVSVEHLRSSGVAVAAVDRPTVPKRTVTINPDRIVSDLDRIERENDELRRAARDHRGPTMLIRYEDYFALDAPNQAQAISDIQEFLGLRPVPLQTTHRKMRTGPLSESIANYAEFKEVVASSRYSHWLTD